MRERVITACVLAPIVLAAIFFTNPWPFEVLILIMCLIGAHELGGILGAKGFARFLPGIPVLLVIWMLAVSKSLHAPNPLPAMSLVNGLLACAAVSRLRDSRLGGTGIQSAFACFAGFWLAASVLAVVALHDQRRVVESWDFHTPVLLAIVPLWAGDIAAIFAGKAFGKHPMAPSISPKKTWEGGIANFFACLLLGCLLGPWCNVGLPLGTACGVVAGIFGQLGDLFESFLKRQAGVKDSGTLLPGHGGVLDRIDSILFTAPVVALVLTFASR